MAKQRKSKQVQKKYPDRAKDVPVTQAMLFEVRDGLKANIDRRFHEIKLLVEEQNARNRIVLDGLTNLFARQERIEKKIG